MKQWVNEDRTILVRQYENCPESMSMEVATREHPGAIWGPPVVLRFDSPAPPSSDRPIDTDAQETR